MDEKILEQRARAFDYLFDAIVVTDLAGMITDWNAGAVRLYGYQKDEVLGKHVSLLHAPEDVERISAAVFAGIQTEGYWTGELKRVCKDACIGWIESMVVPLFDDAGTMTGALGINRDISDRIRNEEELFTQANYDQLTELPNRYYLYSCLEWMIASARRDGSRFALIFIDLDDFKRVNDEAGHQVGDRVLKEAARRIEGCLRESDMVARVGGDEFVVVATHIDTDRDGNVVMETIASSLQQILYIEGGEIALSASLGMALYPDQGDDIDTLLGIADSAMYRQKKKLRFAWPERLKPLPR